MAKKTPKTAPRPLGTAPPKRGQKAGPAAAKAKRRPAAKARARRTRRKKAPLDPRSLTIAATAKLTGVPTRTLREHLRDGLPTDSQGRIDLVVYAAWLNECLQARRDGSGAAE